MPHVEAPFIIAVIREKEKGLLGDNEITRMMHASSAQEAREVLLATPYAMFLPEGTSIRDGLASAMEHEFLWLAEHVDNANILAFIAARYDVLHLAQAIIALATGEPHAPAMSRIGMLSHDMLQAMVFTEGYVAAKENRFWVDRIRAQKKAIQSGSWSMSFLFASMQRVLEERLEQLAETEFMKTIAQQTKEHHERDVLLQQDASLQSATQYELEWDVKTIELTRPLRFEPLGYDPIIAYWITKEMEVKTISLMVAALANGFSKEEIPSLIRPFAHV